MTASTTLSTQWLSQRQQLYSEHISLLSKSTSTTNKVPQLAKEYIKAERHIAALSQPQDAHQDEEARKLLEVQGNIYDVMEQEICKVDSQNRQQQLKLDFILQIVQQVVEVYQQLQLQYTSSTQTQTLPQLKLPKDLTISALSSIKLQIQQINQKIPISSLTSQNTHLLASCSRLTTQLTNLISQHAPGPVPVLFSQIKEQQNEIQELQKEIPQLESKARMVAACNKLIESKQENNTYCASDRNDQIEQMEYYSPLDHKKSPKVRKVILNKGDNHIPFLIVWSIAIVLIFLLTL